MGVVHGDLASENILIDAKSCDVKLIDYDLSQLEGVKVCGAGNIDFASPQIMEAIRSQKKMITSKSDDLYALAICCYLVIGDNKKLLLESLSWDEGMPHEEKLKQFSSSKY